MNGSIHDGTTETGVADLTETERHQLLAVEQRQTTIEVLADRSPPVALEDLAATVAAREGDIDSVDEGTISDVALTLHHLHLPKMAEYGVVDYDPERNRVESCSDRMDGLLDA